MNLLGRDQAGEDIGGLLDVYDAMVKTVTGAQIQQAAKTYFNESNYARFVLLPENAKSNP